MFQICWKLKREWYHANRVWKRKFQGKKSDNHEESLRDEIHLQSNLPEQMKETSLFNL